MNIFSRSLGLFRSLGLAGLGGLAITLALSIACSSGDKAGEGGDGGSFTCSSAYGDECGKTCDAAQSDCATGLFCSTTLVCEAECTKTQASHCVDGTCSASGKCDGGVKPGNTTTLGSGGTTAVGDGGTAGAAGGNSCISGKVDFTGLKANVMLLVDYSGSMDWKWDQASEDSAGTGPQRWSTLKSALIGTGTGSNQGVIGANLDSLRFGMVTYTKSGSTCPNLKPNAQGVAVADDNYADIFDFYNPIESSPSGGTPTGAAIETVAAEYAKVELDGPKVLLVATDGVPYTCESGSTGDEGKAAVLAATEAAHDLGIEVYVLYVSAPTSDTLVHLQEFANVGRGLDKDASGADAAPYYAAETPEDLNAAFDSIVSSIKSCDIALDGAVVAGQESQGTIKLNGTALKYNDADGWIMLTPRSVRLQGQACTDLKSNGVVDIGFPCGTFIEGPEIQ